MKRDNKTKTMKTNKMKAEINSNETRWLMQKFNLNKKVAFRVLLWIEHYKNTH